MAESVELLEARWRQSKVSSWLPFYLFPFMIMIMIIKTFLII